MDTAIQFYRYVLASEEECVKYLKERGLLPTPEKCARMRNGKPCDGLLKECTKKSRKRDSNGEFVMTVFLKCRKKGCQTYHSIRKNNDFFTSKDKNGKCNSGLSLCEIVEIVWYWAVQSPVRQTERLTKRSRNTIHFWNGLCRKICVLKYAKREKLGGRDAFVQIVEAPFAKAKKQLRKQPRPATREPDDEQPWAICIGAFDLNNMVAERRFFVVETRNADNVIPIIVNEIQPGTTVITEDREMYSTLATSHDFVHRSVNNCEYFINPSTGTETESMAAIWQSVKYKFGIKVFDEDENLNRHLKEEWWRSVVTTDVFETFLDDLKLTYD